MRRQTFKGYRSANVEIDVGVAFDAGEEFLRNLQQGFNIGKKKGSAHEMLAD